VTTPIPEDDREGPLRLQSVVARPEGWRGRSNSLVVVGLVGFVAIAIVLGRAFGDGPANPAAVVAGTPTVIASSTPSTLPSRRPTPTPEPLATPLPTREVVGGRIPTERRLVYANGLQLLDLSTGTLASPMKPSDALFMPISNDQLVCACLIRGGPTGTDGAASDPGLRVGRYDLDGKPIVENDLLTFDGVVPVPDITDGINLVAALDADQRNMAVLAVVRRPPVWTVELDVVDVKSGRLIGTASLDSFPVDVEAAGPSASPRPGGRQPDGVYAWANSIAVSPDRRYVYASVSVSEVRAENWTNTFREWMIPILRGAPGTAVPLATAAGLRLEGWCLGRPLFVDSALMVQVCTPVGIAAPGSSYYVRRITTAGASPGDLIVTGQQFDGSYPATAVIDRARRVALVWDPLAHSMTRVGIDDGVVHVGMVPASYLPEIPLRRDGSYLGSDPGLVVSPDGQRLYAIGLTGGAGPAGASTGVWVFDAQTLNLVGHWEPRAFLTSLALSADGRFMYAAGAAGFDLEGRENPWPASVTVYDATTGEIQVLYGAVAGDTWVSFPTWN
jgi:hypothetical protein